MSNTVTAAIASLCNGVSTSVNGVTLTVKGINPPPAQLSTAKLPCAYVLSGPATHDMTSHGADWRLEVRQYRVQVAMDTKEQATREIKESQTQALISALVDKLAQYPHLGVAGVEAAVTSDTGSIGIEDSPDREYVGFEINLEVRELIDHTYAINE